MSSKPIPDAPILDPTKIHNDFASFRNDELHFISHCIYYDYSKENRQVVRCVAMTPSALFVTWVNGQMDRAFRYDAIKKVTYQNFVKKRIFGFEKRLHYVLNIVNEPDCHISFETGNEVDSKNKEEFPQAKSFLIILTAVVNAAKKEAGHDNDIDDLIGDDKGGALEVIEAPVDADIKSYICEDTPKSFMTPTEIVGMNAQRRNIMSCIDTLGGEIAEAKKELAEIVPAVTEARKTLKGIQGNSGPDLDSFIGNREKLRTEFDGAKEILTSLDIDINKTIQDTTRMSEQLSEEKVHYDTLVKNSISNAGKSACVEQEKIIQLREKAQKRETDAAVVKLNATVEKLKVFPSYSGHDAMALSANNLEKEINANINKWAISMEGSNKVETFLDHMRTEADRLTRHFEEQYQLKMELIVDIEGEDRKSRKNSSLGSFSPKMRRPPSISDEDDLMLDDDDLLGGTIGGDAKPEVSVGSDEDML